MSIIKIIKQEKEIQVSIFSNQSKNIDENTLIINNIYNTDKTLNAIHSI